MVHVTSLSRPTIDARLYRDVMATAPPGAGRQEVTKETEMGLVPIVDGGYPSYRWGGGRL